MHAVDMNEYKAIEKTVQHYLDGARSGKGDEMRPAFHEQATIFGYVGEDLFAGPIEGLYAWNDENGAAVDVDVHVTIMEVVETVAVVRVDADNWTGHRFTDFFTLRKVDNQWKVMNKQQATNVVGQMFVSPGSPVVVERPGCSLIAPIYSRAGADILPVATDQDGLRVDLLPERQDALIAVTPERQFPMGCTMPAARREALLDWAQRHNAHVFEVDFDSDFRYEGSPQPALQTLDRHGRFIYAGSFALTIGPGLRIGYLVLPPTLVDSALEALRLLDHAYPCQSQGAPWLDQAVLTDFLNNGNYDKQLRRLRKTYMARRNALMDALREHFGKCDLLGTGSGTHLAWRLPDHMPDAPTCQALARSVGVTLNTMQLETVTGAQFLPDWERYLLLGYADLQPETISAAIRRFAGVVNQ